MERSSGFMLGMRLSHSLYMDVVVTPLVFAISVIMLVKQDAFGAVVLFFSVYVPRCILAIKCGVAYSLVHVKHFKPEWSDLNGLKICEKIAENCKAQQGEADL